MTFLILNKDFLKDKIVRKLPKSIYHIMIDLIFLSFEWKHKPFFRTPEQLYDYLNVNKMGLNRAIKRLSVLGISIEYKNQKYHFDLSAFLEGYAPLGNKLATINKNDSNKSVTDNEVQ